MQRCSCVQVPQEEVGASSDSPRSAGASSFTQGSPEARTASAAKVRKPRKRKHANVDLQTQVGIVSAATACMLY